MMFIETNGYPSIDEIREANGWPSKERLESGPVAIIECVQKIPCNPCMSACPFGAISIEGSITNTPRVNYEKCTGCGTCIAFCPGLAIFVVNQGYSETEATISFPFEYVPMPQPEDTVQALNRAGEFVCIARVVKVAALPRFDHTAVVTIAVPKAYMDEVRTIRRPNAPSVPVSAVAASANDMLPDDVLVCRCEEVTAGEIRRAIRELHATTLNEVKKRTRCSMGLCQGRTCQKLVGRILSQETGTPVSELAPVTDRPPVRPITFGELAGE